MSNDQINRRELVEQTDTVERRNILKKSIGAGGLLATAVWTQPVVESVMLPAHAQTSELDSDPDPNPDPPDEPECPDGLIPTAQLDATMVDLGNACDTADPETITNTSGTPFLVYDNTQGQLGPRLHVANLNLTNIMADFGTFAGDIARTVVFSESEFGEPILSVEETVGNPPGDETVVANGSGPVSFSNITIPMSHTTNGEEDWAVLVTVSFISACGSTEISFVVTVVEDSDLECDP